MRTEEEIFDSLASGDFVCPCGIQCIKYLRKATISESEISDTLERLHHTDYDSFLECVKYSVIKEVLLGVYCYHNKVMTNSNALQIKGLPAGSESLLPKGYLDQSAIFAFCNSCDNKFFKKFQLADNSEELRKLTRSRLFEICAYLISSVKNENSRASV